MTTTPTRVSRASKYGAKASRFYEVNGVQYPSVTTVLSAINKPALLGWAANLERAAVLRALSDVYTPPAQLQRAELVAAVEAKLGKARAHEKELTKAGDIGSAAHARIEWVMRKERGLPVGPEPALSEQALWAFMAWEDWSREVDLKPIAVEEVVYSKKYGYAGTLDLLGELTDAGARHKVLADWKTGKAIYAEALLQNAAYVHAAIEMGDVEPPVNGCIVRLPKNLTDPAFEVRFIQWEAQEDLFQVFLAVLDLWKWLEKQ